MPDLSNLFGVLNLNKPAGITSRDLVNKVQRMIKPVKVGHAGTLDPMATGVLLVCVGPATRLVSTLQEGAKTYVTEFTLGQTSDTDDSTGVIETIQFDDPQPLLTDIASCLDAMTGIISQVPPDYSAVHVDGQRAYALARKGHELTLKARQIEIHSIEILRYEWPRLELKIVCGSGTYIRSIARDLGAQLGCGALMSRLERTQIGEFALRDSADIELITRDNISQHLWPAIKIVHQLSKYDCNSQDITDLLCGRRIVFDSHRSSDGTTPEFKQTVALTQNAFSELVALATFELDHRLQPQTVFLRRPQ